MHCVSVSIVSLHLLRCADLCEQVLNNMGMRRSMCTALPAPWVACPGDRRWAAMKRSPDGLPPGGVKTMGKFQAQCH